MVSRRVNESKAAQTRRPPATTPEGRENQLIGLAVDLAEKQLLEGTASAQVISHYLKMGSSREKLEQERIEEDIKTQQAKREVMENMARMEDLLAGAIDAFRGYAGQDTTEQDDGYED